MGEQDTARMWIHSMMDTINSYHHAAPDLAMNLAEALCETLEERSKGSKVLGWLGQYSRDGRNPRLDWK